MRIGGAVTVNLEGVASACVLGPKTRAEPPEARERTWLETVIAGDPAERV